MSERWYPLAVRFKQAPETFVSPHRVFFVRWGNNLFFINCQYMARSLFGVLKQALKTFVSSHRVFFVRWGYNLFHILPVCGPKLLLDFMLNDLVAGIFLACSLSLFLVRRFSEGNTYGRPFLELVNLCGINRWIPEVNSSRKLDPKSSIDRS